ncbi:hypothetical protein KEM48_007445 [Puccinia striiformis f. sp. tritici PST-130]|nr:hypothetical protein KEM48_007445 [Puccinia striiformis f. sp. tritici PST-130]
MTAKLTSLPAGVVSRIIDYCTDGRDRPIGTNRGDKQSQCPDQVTWPEGLPANPLLPLALVSRTFRQCAQARLFNKVRLKDQCEAYLFLQALTCTSTDEPGVRSTPINSCAEHDTTQGGELESVRSSDNSHSNLNQHGRLGRSIEFQWNVPSSMGMGGGSLVCDILRSCPLLENITIRITFLNHCEEPLLEALKSCPLVKNITIDTDIAWCSALQSQEAVTRLFNSWKSLETVDLSGICGWPVELDNTLMKPIPTLNCALQIIILTYPQLDGRELSLLLKSSIESIRTLRIHRPRSKLDRTGLCQILKECTGPKLESLTVELNNTWYLIPSCENDKNSNDPVKNRGLFDIAFKSSLAPLRNLTYLNISGNLVGSEFFNLLPQSIVTLELDDCRVSGTALSNALSSWRGIDGVEIATGLTFAQSQSPMDGRLQWLPDLRRCAIRNEHQWSWQTRKDIWTKMQARGVNYQGHWERHFHFSDSEEEEDHDDDDHQGNVTDGSDSSGSELSSYLESLYHYKSHIPHSTQAILRFE